MKMVRKLFLCFGLLTFVISVVICVYDIFVSSLNTIAIAQKDDIYGSKDVWFWICLNVILITIPFLLSELSIIKNIYMLLKKELSKTKKFLIIISSILSLGVIVMIILIENKIFQYRVGNTILLTFWPTIILSFALGSVHRKSAKSADSTMLC